MAIESLRFDGKLHFQPVLINFLLVIRPTHQLIAMVIEAPPVNNRQIGRLQILFHQIQNGQLKIFTVNRYTVRPDENQRAPFSSVHLVCWMISTRSGEWAYTPLSMAASRHMNISDMDFMFASHQDPDIIGAIVR